MESLYDCAIPEGTGDRKYKDSLREWLEGYASAVPEFAAYLDAVAVSARLVLDAGLVERKD